MKKGKPGRPVTSTRPDQVAKRAWQRANRLARLCIQCAKPASGSLCTKHRKRALVLQRKRARIGRANGKCCACPARRLAGSVFCRRCRKRRAGRPSRQPAYRKKHERRKARAA